MVSKLAAVLVGLCCLTACDGGASKSMNDEAAHQVSVIGDSFTSGSLQGGVGPNGWPALVRKILGDEDVDVEIRYAPEAGAGYATVGNSGGVFDNQVSAVVGIASELVVFFGSTNDGVAPPDELRKSVAEDFARAKALAPHAKLLVIGPTWLTTDPPTEMQRVRDILRDESSAAGAVFVDPLAEHWIADRPQLIGGDGIHPTDEGHRYLAMKIAPLIATELERG
jgi:lysophospholipase L1-like esterase